MNPNLPCQCGEHSRLEESIENIRRSIDSARNWMIITLVSALLSTLYLGMSLGEWKGKIESRIAFLEQHLLVK